MEGTQVNFHGKTCLVWFLAFVILSHNAAEKKNLILSFHLLQRESCYLLFKEKKLFEFPHSFWLGQPICCFHFAVSQVCLLYWFTIYNNYNIDCLLALICCNICTVTIKSQAVVKNGRTASVLDGCNFTG